MGIPGIYKEIGPGTRISLAKLAIEQLEKTNKPLRLAIDVAIWQFQIRSGQGGQNPALRTLYYRLLKLLGLGIRPLFVFDGPYKPKLKRNVKRSPFTACLDNFLVKELLNRFGFPYHDAPGEAEAECALFQKKGIVDAVLSEDVDTMMFGSCMSLRGWTCEGARSAKTPTHVTMHTAESTKQFAGLDYQGMILVALMSGGDYDTEGLANCGPKIACEAARAGFGRGLYQLSKDDHEGLKAWRESLQHELRTNESRFFKQKHKTISIPDTFPDQNVLNYYKRPVVSSSDKVIRLRDSITWEANINIPAMRAFVAEAFNWTYLVGAKHFIRSLAPALLAHTLITAGLTDGAIGDDLEAKATAEAEYVVSIHGRRLHWNTDGCPELRISYVPANIVGLDLSNEEDISRADDALEDLQANEIESDREDRPRSASPTKRRDKSVYDPDLPEKIWMLETIVKLGAPLMVETWEEDMRKPARFASRKAREKAAVSKAAKHAPHGTIDKYLKVTKQPYKTKEHLGFAGEKCPSGLIPSTMPAADNAIVLRAEALNALRQNTNSSKRPAAKKSASSQEVQKSSRRIDTKRTEAPATPPNTKGATPWTLSGRPPESYSYKSKTRYSALGIYAPDDPESYEPRSARPNVPIQESDADESPDLPRVSTAGMLQRKCSREVSVDSSPAGALGTRLGENFNLHARKQQAATKPPTKKKQDPSEIDNGTVQAMESELSSSPLEQEHRSGTMKKPLPPTQRLTEDIGRSAASEHEDIYVPSNYDHSNPLATEASPVSDHSSLPSPSAVFYPGTRSVAESSATISAFPRHDGLVSAIQQESNQRRKAVMIRESLEGAWKHCEPGEEHIGKQVFANVEVLDMTGSEGP